MKKKDNKFGKVITDIGSLIIGGIALAISYNMFLIPANVYIGGAGGIATLLNILYGFPTGVVIICINIPLIALFCYFYGFKNSVNSILGILATSVIIDLTEKFHVFPQPFPTPGENPLLCALFGGITVGISTGVLFWRGFTTGGSDIGALLLKVRFRNIPTAKLIFAVDIAVVVTAAVVTKDYLSVFYSFISIVVSAAVIDIVIGGFDRGKLAYIFSDKYEEIASEITNKMHRGVTILEGYGWYTKESKKVILCAVRKRELFLLKNIAKKTDDKVFMIFSDATEMIGEGFKTHVEDTEAITPVDRSSREKVKKRADKK